MVPSERARRTTSTPVLYTTMTRTLVLGWVLVLVLQLLTTSARTHSIRGRVLVLVALVLVCVYRSTSIRILIPVVPHQYASVL